MIYGGPTANDAQVLTGMADALMWAGRDRAADLIYAAVEADQPAAEGSDPGEWREVFGG